MPKTSLGVIRVLKLVRIATIWFPVYRLLEEYLQGSNCIHIPYIYLI